MFLSDRNIRALTITIEQRTLFETRIKIIWEEQLVDPPNEYKINPPNEYITPVNAP